VIGDSALDIERARACIAISAGLACIDALHFTAVEFRVDIVKVRNEFVTEVAERNSAIGIQQVRMVIVNQVLDALKVL